MSQVFGRSFLVCLQLAPSGLVRRYGGSYSASANRRCSLHNSILRDLQPVLPVSPQKTRPETASQLATSEFHARAQGEDHHPALWHLHCILHPSALTIPPHVASSRVVALVATESVLSTLTRTVLPLQKVKLCNSSRHHRGIHHKAAQAHTK
jgi:hypothetical protein